MWNKLLATTDDKAVFLARLALGVVFFAHGAQKMLGWFGGSGFSGTLDAFSGMGMPVVITVLVICGEFFGSLGLLVGFLSRIAAAGIGIIMLGAVFMVHAANGFFMNWFGNQQGEGFEYHILAIGLALVVLIKGSGAFSVDRALSR
jgi:putative oxidoreductase